MSLWWFEQLADLVLNHVITADTPGLVGTAAWCVGRWTCCRWSVCGARVSDRIGVDGLPPHRFGVQGDSAGRVDRRVAAAGADLHPATKAAIGDHDENVDFDHVVATVGPELAQRLRATSIAVYDRAERIARGAASSGRHEVRVRPGGRRSGDRARRRVLTPDSSRYWPADSWEPGRAQPSFDKQYVRDWLTSPESGWDRTSDTTSAVARRGRRPDPGEICRGLRTDHRVAVRLGFRYAAGAATQPRRVAGAAATQPADIARLRP